MTRMIVASTVIFVISIVMSMVGRGGGNFYVPILVASGCAMHQAATSGQLILVVTAVAASLVFHKHKTVDWKLALMIDPPTDVMAFVGGFLAHQFASFSLKLWFAVLLVIASFLMIFPVKNGVAENRGHPGFWHRSFGEYNYTVNLWLAIPVTAAVGFFAGMVGISGGSFKIPLMVLLCGIPMRVAVGTSSVMIAATAMMGFIGHAIAGDFKASIAIPVTLVAIIGGLIGGKVSVKTEPGRLKRIFAYTTLAAAVFMASNALLSMGQP